MKDEESKRSFRKYDQNRRLWDQDNSRYATVEDIVEAVEMGLTVEVIAVRGRGRRQVNSGDVTLSVLLDAFYKQQKGKPTVRPEDLVRLMRRDRPMTWTQSVT